MAAHRAIAARAIRHAVFGMLAVWLAVGMMSAAVSASDAIDCAPSAKLRFICGAERPEDVARIPGTRWLVFSGFSNGAGLKLVDSASHSMRLWYSGAPAQIRVDLKSFPMCSSPPSVETYNAQGISLRTVGPESHRLYVVNHGGREAIEVFSIDARNDEPELTWIGCVPLPDGIAANSVATYSDGTILASVLTHAGTSITDFVLGKTTGGVYEWRPGSEAFKLLEGTQLPGNNGIETSPDDKEFYVVAFGWRSVVVFSRADPSKPIRRAVAPGFMPDNIHWHEGRLLLAGMQYDEPACGGLRKIVDGKADGMLCRRGYSVAQLDPSLMEFKLIAYDGPDSVFNGVSAAVVLDDQLWLASYQSDRVALRKLDYSVSR